MNISSITQQTIYTDQDINSTQNSTADFQDELNKQQGGRWKNHYIDGLTPSQNQALNNKLEEMGITSDYEIYKIKVKMEGKMDSFKSIGWNPSNYTENHIRSLEFGETHGGLSDTNKKVLEVLYAIQENDLKNPSIENESNNSDSELQKFRDDLRTKGAMKFLHDFNLEKIEKMVKKFEEKLLKEMENNPNSDMNIDEMVNDYRKQLLENLAKLEETKKTPVNIAKLEYETNNNSPHKLEDLLKI